jgi:hypothetical protein
MAAVSPLARRRPSPCWLCGRSFGSRGSILRGRCAMRARVLVSGAAQQEVAGEVEAGFPVRTLPETVGNKTRRGLRWGPNG